MRHYPVYLDLSGATCLVLGAGDVGRRKVAGLLECGPARVLVFDPADPGPKMQRLMDTGPIVYATRPFREDDLDGVALAFAASGDREANRSLAELCRGRGVICNVADAPEEGNCIIPATARAGDLAAALSTGGASPALARRMRTELETWLAGRYEPLTRLMGRLRPLVLAMGMEQKENAALFRALAWSELPDLLAAADGDTSRVRAELERLLPPALHAHMEDLLHELV